MNFARSLVHSLHLSLSLACSSYNNLHSCRSESDLLVNQVALVLVTDGSFLEHNNLLALNAFNFAAVVFNLGTQFATLFHVVKLVLMTHLSVLNHLILDFDAVLN